MKTTTARIADDPVVSALAQPLTARGADDGMRWSAPPSAGAPEAFGAWLEALMPALFEPASGWLLAVALTLLTLLLGAHRLRHGA